MTKRKIGLLALMGLIASVWTLHAGYEDFVASLKNIGLNGAAISASSRVSRDELASVLSFVDCQDCHRPGSKLIERLTSSRWTSFRTSPGVNFDDVPYSRSLDASNNYYCVAYAAEQGTMTGYPRQTSPLCSGKFCGTNDTTVADFVQVLINILADRIASHYQADRKAMRQRFDDAANSSVTRTYFSLQDAALLRRESNSCTTWKCALTTPEQLKVYLKYCTFNLDSCGMTPQPTAPQNFRPVAELNVLLSEWVITAADAAKLNVGDFVDGEFVLRTLSQVKEKVACTFNPDKDSDQITDYTDNCYLQSNSSQRDSDSDWLGDVCDDDIDGDGVKNPFNVIDENWYINRSVIATFSGTVDNCLETANADQKDTDRNGQGDACQEGGVYALMIAPTRTRNGAYTFTAQFSGALADFSWQFGDGSFGQWKTVSHIFPSPGTYQITLTARAGSRTVTAGVQITVSPAVQTTLGFSLLPKPLSAFAPASITISPITTRSVSRIERKSNGQTKKGAYNQPMSYLYEKVGAYPVIAKAYDDNQIVGYAQASVSLNSAAAAYLQASTLSPREGQQMNFTTITANIAKKDIVAVKRDMGDGTVQTNTQLTQQYTYTKRGPKIITQTLYLLDGTELVNVLTLDVTLATNGTDDTHIRLVPAKLTPRSGEPVRYTFVLEGMNRGQVSRVIIDMNNGQTLSFKQPAGWFSYIYTNPWVYQITAQIEKTDKTRTESTVTISVTDTPLCMQKNTFAVANLCDIDKDQTPDICDDDIDGDGAKNTFGLITNQPAQCIYTSTDFARPSIDDTIARIGAGETLDNCPVTYNADQKDGNGNFIGDVCGELIQKTDDLDEDGIGDDVDLCPIKPENINNIDDEDGCPEELTLIGSASKLQAAQCSLCPCPYVQPDSGLQPGDKIRAVLMNSSGTVRINTSNPYLITE